MAILYGIKNCDTVKKARQWMDKRQINYTFHDYRNEGIDEKLVRQFFDHFGWEKVLNTNSSTYRQLPEWQKDIMTEELAMELILEQPTLIKRPIIKKGREWEVGFSEEKYQALFK